MTATPSEKRLASRYGARKPRSVKRSWILTATVFALLLLGFLVWASFGKGPQADSKTVGFTVLDSTKTTVDIQVTKDPQRAAQCEVSALDNSFAVVGWKIVDIPAEPNGKRETSQTVALITDAKAVSAVVDSCWIRS